MRRNGQRGRFRKILSCNVEKPHKFATAKHSILAERHPSSTLLRILASHNGLNNDAIVLRTLLKDRHMRYLVNWRKTKSQSNAMFQVLWHKIRKLREGLLSHRAYMSPSDFAKGLREYLKRVEQVGGPAVLIDQRDWRNTWNNLSGIHWFGDLAKFDYLSRICLLSLCECPDAIPHTGKGPTKGLKMVYDDNATITTLQRHLATFSCCRASS